MVPAQYALSGTAKVAFVGEAPSDEEVDAGIPLVGPSGRIFDAMLRTAGLDRRNYHVTNVFNEQLPENEVANWTAPLAEARSGGFADLPPVAGGTLRPEYRHHLTRLAEELADVRPDVVVPLGGTALWAFTGQTNISQMRGAVVSASRILPGVKLVPTYHPAFVMRQWKFFGTVVLDFQKAVREAELGRSIIRPVRKLLLEPTIPDIRAFRKEHLSGSGLISCDIETGWGMITCIGFAQDTENAICIPFVDLRQPDKSYWRHSSEEAVAWDEVQEILEGPAPKLGQNYGAYDAFWLLDKYGIRTNNMTHDTRLLHHALFPESPKDLASMGATYGSQGAWKTMRQKKAVKRDD